MAINFPSSPTLDQIYIYQDRAFRWDGEKWVGAGNARFVVSSTPPANPANGDGWFDTDTSQPYLYVDDGTSQQWVGIGGGEGSGGLLTLPADRIVYVRTDGSDSNDGTANDASHAWLTIQHAVDEVHKWNLNGHNVTIQVADGTYTDPVYVLGPWIGHSAVSSVTLVGNVTTPSNCVISVDNDDCVYLLNAELTIKGFKLTTTTNYHCFEIDEWSRLNITDKMEYGVCAGYHIWARNKSFVTVRAAYTISGSADYHYAAEDGSLIKIDAAFTVTLTGTPAFTAFAGAWTQGEIRGGQTTWSGSATGPRFEVGGGGIIANVWGNTNNQCYFPGNEAGWIDENSHAGGAYDAYAPRRVLWATLNLYVRADGSDENDGGANTAARAFRTIQAAINWIFTFTDGNGGYEIIVNLADGTGYGPIRVDSRLPGDGILHVIGNTTTPANVPITNNNSHAVRCLDGGRLYIEGVKITTTGWGSGILVNWGGRVYISGKIEFGACVTYHMQADGGGQIEEAHTNGMLISGGATCHIRSQSMGYVYLNSGTCTISGTPNFSYAFALSNYFGFIDMNSSRVWSGSATGKRYVSNVNSVIETGGSGASWLPGDSAGTTATQGQYF